MADKILTRMYTAGLSRQKTIAVLEKHAWFPLVDMASAVGHNPTIFGHCCSWGVCWLWVTYTLSYSFVLPSCFVTRDGAWVPGTPCTLLAIKRENGTDEACPALLDVDVYVRWLGWFAYAFGHVSIAVTFKGTCWEWSYQFPNVNKVIVFMKGMGLHVPNQQAKFLQRGMREGCYNGWRDDRHITCAARVRVHYRIRTAISCWTTMK